ncbi:hypothetical protein Csa_019703, partial [Cucumis sativus]
RTMKSWDGQDQGYLVECRALGVETSEGAAESPEDQRSAKTSFHAQCSRVPGHLKSVVLISGCMRMDLMRKRVKLILKESYGIRQASACLLFSLFSLPVPTVNLHAPEEDPTTRSDCSVPDYLEHGRIHKLLLFGIEGSGTSTLFKKATILYGTCSLQ